MSLSERAVSSGKALLAFVGVAMKILSRALVYLLGFVICCSGSILGALGSGSKMLGIKALDVGLYLMDKAYPKQG